MNRAAKQKLFGNLIEDCFELEEKPEAQNLFIEMVSRMRSNTYNICVVRELKDKSLIFRRAFISENESDSPDGYSHDITEFMIYRDGTTQDFDAGQLWGYYSPRQAIERELMDHKEYENKHKIKVRVLDMDEYYECESAYESGASYKDIYEMIKNVPKTRWIELPD